MKPSLLLVYPTATICLVLAASAQSRPLSSILKSLHILGNSQFPLTNPSNIAMPPGVSSGVIISDVMGKTQTIAIFSGLTRDIDSVADRLDDASKNATVLAPDNAAMKGLSRKPWEDPKEYESLGESAYQGQAGEDRAHRNMRRFVEAHIVATSPWREHEKVETLAGNTVWYETKGGEKVIQPGNIQVLSVADKVGNGEVWILKDVINYQ
ncbi:FAS1 domain-containing protein [Lepidopterella palustris CBS 459.81]|uniref:FAS1 domain-containing protein n=1 Tax=Lepidopterella palustris CBS 459.81 TaxID=1314670 RepID=A0A8E2JIJ9_9PEZI|nr:FAS1 domain-containing protein [Lepidopterella palustris CBS 459.81]